jgi:hypothetical protein
MAKRKTGRDVTATRYHASVYDFKDTDLMAKVQEAGAEGVTALELAEVLGMKNGDGTSAIGVRFAWMKRFGMLSYDERKHLWTLTDGAERVMAAQTRAAITEVVGKFPDEAMIEVMADITSRYRVGDPMVAQMLRREFQYGTSPRSRVWSR